MPAVPTPFREDGAFAPELLSGVLEELGETGIAGCLILGSNGEAFSLTDAERREVLETARRSVPARLFFLAGCGAESTRLALDRVREAAAAGADAALVLTPHYLKGSFRPEGYYEHYARLADAAPIPIYAYNIPQFTGVALEVGIVARLAAHPNFHGMKDSSGNITYLSQIVAAAGPEFRVLAGSDKVLASAALMGAAGAVLALANVAPERCVRLLELCRAGKWDEAAHLQSSLIPVGTAVTTRFGVPGLKAGMRLLGRDAGSPRLPLLPLPGAETREIEATFREAGML